MLENNELISLEIKSVDEKNQYFALPESLALLEKPLARSKLKILSPFDNLLIQRKRMVALFDFDYQIECYVPQQKRQYGYFVLPILWRGRFAARIDCKADRKTGTLLIHRIFIEPWLKDTEAFIDAFQAELKNFMKFNQCHEITLSNSAASTLQNRKSAH